MQDHYRILGECRLCGHACGADRLSGQTGRCGAGRDLVIARHLLHFGEEPPISGERGSGTIFFSGCPLSCLFCQNYQISQERMGRETAVEDLAGMMLNLAEQGAHNINLVSPTPWVSQIAAALALARQKGLDLPVVYNTGGFDSPAALKIMDGLVDVYLPDNKFGRADKAGRDTAFSLFNARNYCAVNRAAIREMFRQVGRLQMDENGVAVKGLLIRHLVLPEDLAATGQVLSWLAETFGPDVWISLMAQYFPCHRALAPGVPHLALTRHLTETEYEAAVDAAVDLGLENVFVQDLTAPGTYVPDFTTEPVFSNTK